MQPFGSDSGPFDALESSVDRPTGPIVFDTALEHEQAGDGWATWSSGYVGDVYANVEPAP